MSLPSLKLNLSALAALQSKTPSGSSQKRLETETPLLESGLSYKPLAAPKNPEAEKTLVKSKPIPTAEAALKELKTFAAYDIYNGGFVATRKRQAKGPDIGEPLGTILENHRCRGKGYKYINLLGRPIKIARLVWLWHHNEWPTYGVDHINRDRLDDRIENLRDVPNDQNSRNRSRQSNNTSGHTGVRFNKHAGKYVARVTVNGIEIHLGLFSSLEEAVSARKEFLNNSNYGFTQNHGEP